MKKKKQPVLIAPLKPALWTPKLPALVGLSAVAFMMVTALGTYTYIRSHDALYDGAGAVSIGKTDTVDPFPVGVDPKRKVIVENPRAETYLDSPMVRTLARRNSTDSYFAKALSVVANLSLTQNLASPTARILIIEPGERKEEIISNFARILHWNADQRNEFESQVVDRLPYTNDGAFFPGTYVVSRSAEPKDVAPLIITRFEKEIIARYNEEVESQVSIQDALTIASLLEREARDYEDMRLISGVIWNRLFAGMKLQLDATMQYAKADGTKKTWWPAARPADKDIDSPYNTYKYPGLPPAPIANPSLGAIVAALNPKKTDCMFYFHDKKGNFHCSEDYQGHVEGLTEQYGQGR